MKQVFFFSILLSLAIVVKLYPHVLLKVPKVGFILFGLTGGNVPACGCLVLFLTGANPHTPPPQTFKSTS